MTALFYVGPRADQFGTGACPSGKSYVVNPGTPLMVEDADADYLCKTGLFEQVKAADEPAVDAPVVPRKRKSDDV